LKHPYAVRHNNFKKLKPVKKILLVANTAWNLWNYRQSLIRALTQSGYTVVLVAPDDRFRDLLLQIPGVRFIALRHLSRKGLSPLQNLKLLLELSRIFRQEKPDIALLYTVKPNILGNFAAELAGDFKTVSVVEGLGYSGSAAARWRWLAALLYRLALRKTQKVVFLNRDDCREFLNKHLIRPAQAQIIPGPGIDLSHFQPAGNPPAYPFVFLFSGRLLPEKGIREFAEAAKLLHRENVRAIFRILGAPDPGNPASIHKVEVAGWAAEGFLEYLGSADDVRPALAEAHVLVLPSFYREGVPRSVLEAMAMGKIIITTDTPGCRDTVDDGKNGFLVPLRDGNALSDVMQRVLQLMPEERLEMGARSIRKVKEEFSDEIVIPLYVTLLESLGRN